MTVYICMYIYIYKHPCNLHLRQHLHHHVRILCVILPQICLICLWPPAMETSDHLRKCVFHGTLLELVGRVPVASRKIVSSCDWNRRPSSSYADCLAQRRPFFSRLGELWCSCCLHRLWDFAVLGSETTSSPDGLSAVLEFQRLLSNWVE